MGKNYDKLIKEICNEEKIDYKVLSNSWCYMLTYNNKTKFIVGYKFDLNNHGIGCIIDDKYATFEVLKAKGISVIEHNLLYSPNNKNSYAMGFNDYNLVEKYFDKHKCIVIKPNDGTCGNGVYCIKDKEEILPTLDKLFLRHFSISYCPYYEYKNEYRVIMLDNECMIIHGKERPIVIGDGLHTKRELLLKFNENYFKNITIENDRILDKGEIFTYDWRFNLSNGARAFDITDNILKDKLIVIAKQVTNSLNIRFCSVDIIEVNDGTLRVIEVNSGVMLENYMQRSKEHYNLVKSTYKKALLKMFEV